MPSINVAINPVVDKNSDDKDVFAPRQVDYRNLEFTDVGTCRKRNGYAEDTDLSVNDAGIDLLIPKQPSISTSDSYAVTTSGRVFRITPSTSEYTGAILRGTGRSQYAPFEDIIVLCKKDGPPVKISGGTTSVLGGSPPNAAFVDTISSYVLMAGHHDTQWRYSDVADAETWPALNLKSVKDNGETIKYLKVFREKVYIFKDRSIEVWVLVSGTNVFLRNDGAWVSKGLGASYSVVEANNRLYFYGNDGDFYELQEGGAVAISQSYRSELNKLLNADDIYGYDCRKEGAIRWFAPIDGKCFVYDYIHGTFREDNIWVNGQWERLPWNSYMEQDQKQYFGSYDNGAKVYEWSKDYLDDNGDEIRCFRKFTIPFARTGRNVRVSRIRLRTKRGVETSSISDPKIIIRWNFDGGTWTEEEASLGQYGDEAPWDITWTNIGRGRELEVEIVETDAVKYLLTDMVIDYKEMAR